MEPLFWPNSGQVPIRNLRRQLKYGQLFWREVGRGQTVVFLHGSWTDGDQWNDMLSTLGQKYHCLAPDLLGFGESERLQDKSAYSIAMQVSTLAELLSSLRLDSVVLVGHSLGAWVAARYALQYPQQVQGLCVLEPEGMIHDPKRWWRLRWLVSPLAGLWLAITKLFVRPSKSVPGKVSSQRRAWLQDYHLRQLLRRHPAACRLLFQRRRNVLESEIVGNQLATLTIPMIALQASGETSRQLTQTFTMAAPDAMVKILPDTDDSLRHQAQAITEVLEHWLPMV